MSEPWQQRLAEELGREALYDEGVEAARNACVAGASLASAAITAAAWYDNPLTGVPALHACMRRLSGSRLDVASLRLAFRRETHPETGDAGWSPGFGFVDRARAGAVLDALSRLYAAPTGGQRGRFFLDHHELIASESGPLNPTGLAALTFVDHGADDDLAEALFLCFRIAPALREAAAARRAGVTEFPFLTDQYVYEGARPEPRVFDTAALLRQVGLE